MHPALRALAYLCIGMTGEIWFTAIKALIQKKDLRLQGYTQLWVAPLYALGGLFLFEPVHNAMINTSTPLPVRFLAYALLIFALEYAMGAFAKAVTGKCPWEYKGKYAVRGFINLTHLPFWGALGLLFEIIHRYLVTR
jgi:hypothetical protein